MVECIFISPSDVEVFGKINIKRIDADMFPLGIAYIASYIREKGHTVKLFSIREFGEDWEDKLKKIIIQENPIIVGIPCVTPTITDVYKISTLIKKIDNNIKIVVGGPHPSALPEETIFYKDIDIVVIGEGEITFLEILEKFNLNEIKGIYYKEGNKIKHTQPRPLNQNIDSLPIPTYDLLPIKKYTYTFIGKCLIFVTGRGCPYRCAFCSSKVINKGKMRLRSVQKVVDEIEYLYKKHNIKALKFVDDTFTAIPERTIELCKEIRKRKLKIKWGCDTRVNTLSPELLKEMKKAGCCLIKFGIESGDEKILKIIKKDITINQVREAVEMTKKAGIEAHGFFILGNPYDTEETIQKTIDLAKDLNLDYVQFSMMTPYPGTEVYDMAIQNKGIKLLTKDWSDFKRYGKPIIELPTVSSKRLEELHAKAYKEFYFRPKYYFKRILKTKPWHYSKLVYKGLSILGFIKKSN